MLAPKLNYLKASEIYQQTLVLAKNYCPEWSNQWPLQLDTNVDPGLALLRLFADLAEHVTKKVNHIPEQRFLAYLNFMGLSLGYPLASQAPISFTIKKHAAGTMIPAGTAIAYQKNPQLLFYTKEALAVLPLNINIALYIDPDQDTYLDQSHSVTNDQYDFELFDNPDSHPLNHILLLGDSTLFAPNAALQNLKITFSGSNLCEDYFKQWFDGKANSLEVNFENPSSNSLSIIFKGKEGLPSAQAMPIAHTLSNLLSNTVLVGEAATKSNDLSPVNYYWLVAKPAQGVRILNDYINLLPQIDAITCDTSGVDIAPNITLYNDIILDIKNGVYPFSQMPQSQDAFYIGSADVFNRPGAVVTLNFNINPVTNNQVTAQLAWEFWDGKNWQNFDNFREYQFVDKTNNFIAKSDSTESLETCTISFICPPIQPLTIAGQNSLWIRASIASGDYSALNTSSMMKAQRIIQEIPAEILSNTMKTEVFTYLSKQQQLNVKGSGTSVGDITYYPPFIYSLTIAYQYRSTVEQTLVHNNFATANLLRFPYIPIASQSPSFYLGFQLQNTNKNIEDLPLNLFFAIEQRDILSSQLQFNPDNSAIIWKYYDGYNWQILNVIDNTLGLMKPGIVSFKIPSTWQKALLFGQNLFWICFENHYNKKFSPLTKGIYINTVMVSNTKTITGEILGSSTGQLSQEFKFSYKNILKGASIAVIEHKVISQEEVQQLTAVLGENAVTEVKVNGSEYIQVLWQEVDNFLFSTPNSRHYVIHPQKGEILFGDGVRGMIPPKGNHNIIALQYQTTFGEKGNVPASTITHLQTANSHIKSVMNPVAATGGSNGYALQTIKKQGPHYLKSYNRGVLQEDYSALAVQASPLILRAATHKKGQDKIIIYVLADVEAKKPVADYNLLQKVQDYVRQRVYLPLQNKITVRSPDYLPVDVVVQCYAAANIVSHLLSESITEYLEQFLNPRTGGKQGLGWNFEESLSVNQLVANLQHKKEIDSIISVTINGSSQGSIIPSFGQLICCGKITVFVF